jgi:hypothetical protein
MAWKLVLTDLLGTVHGEVTEAQDRKFTLPHMRVPSASFKIPLKHSLAATVMDTDCLLKAYRVDPVYGTQTLPFVGPVVTAVEVGEDLTQTVAVTAAGPFWRLSKRRIAKSRTPAQWVSTDLGTVASQIIDAINLDSFTGISNGTIGASLVGNVGPWNNKNAAEAINELTTGLASFEWSITPTEPTQVGGIGGWPRIGTFNTNLLIGTQKPDAIYEYGTTRANVASYQRVADRSGMLTRAIVSIQGWPDTPYANRTLRIRDSAEIATRGLFEDQVNDAGITDDSLRDLLGDFHLQIRKQPRQIITFRPAMNSKPSPLSDYAVGDFIRARAVVNNVMRFDAMFRVWGITFDIDNEGNEQVELELVLP